MEVELAHPKDTLRKILAALAPDPFVESVSLGGSLGRGHGDEVSDVDLWIEGKWWQPESLGSLFLAATLTKLGGAPFLHGVTVGGTIVDILYGPKAPPEFVEVELPAPAALPVQPLPGCGLVDEFWINSLKHRKNVYRGNIGLLTYGLNFDRQFLLRAWATREGGRDPGAGAFNIFLLKDLYPRYVTPERQALLGLPARDEVEILYAMEAYRDEMTRLFPETTLLEATVRAIPLKPPKPT